MALPLVFISQTLMNIKYGVPNTDRRMYSCIFSHTQNGICSDRHFFSDAEEIARKMQFTSLINTN